MISSRVAGKFFNLANGMSSKLQSGREFHPLSHCWWALLRCVTSTIESTPSSLSPHSRYIVLWFNDFTSPFVIMMLKVDNRKACSYYCHFYTHLFTFLSYATSLKTKEITNQEIKDALRANNCTSVEFDEVKLTANTVSMFKILEYLSEEIRTSVLFKGTVPVKGERLKPHFCNVDRNRQLAWTVDKKTVLAVQLFTFWLSELTSNFSLSFPAARIF